MSTFDRYEWRVMLQTKRDRNPVVFHDHLFDDSVAFDLAALERADYPSAKVWVERREVHDWERVAP